MRLSVAEKCAPDLAKSRAEVQRLKQSVLSLTRHNKSLMLELHRAQAAAQGVETVMSSEEAGVLAQAACQPSAVQWPASAVELIESNKKYEALRQEHRAQGKLLSEYRRAAVELEQRTVQANEAIGAMVRLRGELEPIVAQLKKDHAEDAIWDDLTKLHTTISAARSAGIPEHKVKHLVDRAVPTRRSSKPYACTCTRGSCMCMHQMTIEAICMHMHMRLMHAHAHDLCMRMTAA